MIPILYEADEVAFASNGLGRLRDCISCVVTEERNGIYEVDFEYPVDGANFDKIIPGRIIACEHDESNDVQPFDIVSYEKPLNGIVAFHGVHISYRQNGLTVHGKDINSLADAFTLLQSSTPDNPFTYEADFTSTAYFGAADGVPKSVRQMLGGVEGSILDSYGGEYEFNRFIVKLWSSRGEQKDFTIRYGVNLLDYNDETDYSETYNAAIPYWVGDNGKGVEVCVVGNHAELGEVTYTGREICVPLDLTDKFETKPTKAQLKSEAESYMGANNTNQPQQTITVDFVRLQDYTDFEQFALLLNCKLCDSIRVIFPKYGMDRYYKIVKTVYNVLKDRYDSMELGSLSTTLSDALGISSGGNMGGGDVLADLAQVTTMEVSVPVISAHSYEPSQNYTVPVDSRVSGANLVGIVGVHPSRYQINSQRHNVVDNTTICAGFQNVTATASAGTTTVIFYLLWIKASS